MSSWTNDATQAGPATRARYTAASSPWPDGAREWWQVRADGPDLSYPDACMYMHIYMYMYTHISIYIYTRIYIYTLRHMGISMYADMDMHISVYNTFKHKHIHIQRGIYIKICTPSYTYMYIYIDIYVDIYSACTYVCMYVCMYACMYVYVPGYTYKHMLKCAYTSDIAWASAPQCATRDSFTA